jgi:hypothetical protein
MYTPFKGFRKALQESSPKTIISHLMEKLLKKDHFGIISQSNSIQVINNLTQEIYPYLQLLLEKHHQVFETPKGLPPSQGEHDYDIPMIPRSQSPNVCPYRHPAKNNEMEKIIHELLEVGVIHSSTNPYSSLVIMVLKKEGI